MSLIPSQVHVGIMRCVVHDILDTDETRDMLEENMEAYLELRRRRWAEEMEEKKREKEERRRMWEERMGEAKAKKEEKGKGLKRGRERLGTG